MERKRDAGRPIEQVVTRFIGVAVPLSLHQEIREVAHREGVSATQLYRKAIIQYLDRVKK